MHHRFFSRVRVRLFMIVLAALIPMAALMCHSAFEQRQLAIAPAGEHVLNLLDSMIMNQHALMDRTRCLLATLTRLPNVRTVDPQFCEALLRSLTNPPTPYLAAGIAGRDGSILCSVPETRAETKVASSPHFREALARLDFVVGDYDPAGPGGNAVVYCAFPVLEAGEAVCVLYVAIDASAIERQVSSVSLPAGYALTITDASGTLIASQPQSGGLPGQMAPESRYAAAAISAREPGAILVDNPEQRLVAYTRLGTQAGARSLRAVLSIPTRLLFGNADRLFARTLIGLGLVSLFAVIMTWAAGEAFFLRALKVLTDAAERLALGDFDARTGLKADDEFGQVARAFDRMAEANAALIGEIRRSHAELERAYEETLEGLVKALDLRDHETEGHSWRVTEMTVRVARELGLAGQDLVDTRRGALLHDIGKIGIPDSILLKPGPLTEDEWMIMRRHPVLAFEILYPITYLQNALVIPYFHHERWDGIGYPQGVKGDEIPLAARAFAVVDVYDALTSERPYRPAWPQWRALEYIREESGRHFDPSIVAAFLRLVGES